MHSCTGILFMLLSLCDLNHIIRVCMHLSIVPQHHSQLFIPLKLQTPTSTMMPSNWALSKEKNSHTQFVI